MKKVFKFLVPGMLTLLLMIGSRASAAVKVYPAPDPSLLSSDFKVTVEGQDVPVYKLLVAPEDKTQRLAAVDDKSQYGTNREEAAFGYFDTDGGATVQVTYKENVSSAELLPKSPAIPVTVNGNTVQFSVDGPRNLTLEINHQIVRTLHLFANPMETNAPSPQDPAVMLFAPGDHAVSTLKMPAGKSIFYFAPGVHTIDNLTVGKGQSVYIAGGAVVHSVIRADAPFVVSTFKGKTSKLYKDPAINFVGSTMQLRGRGILDGTQAGGKQLMKIRGQDIRLSDVILQDSGNWFMPIWYSDRVTVTNLKILGSRANSDGIDMYNSRDVTVHGCFIRTVDDVVVIKSKPHKADAPSGDDTVKNIVVQGNTFWSETGHSMEVGTEVGADISTILFKDNDVIRDLARGPAMGIYLSGSGTVSNVTFENLRDDRTGNQCDWGGASGAMFATIKSSQWEAAEDKGRATGRIRGVLFKNIQFTTSPQNPKIRIELEGASDTSDIQTIKFEGITVNGRPLSKANAAIKEKFATNVLGLPR